MLKALKPNLIDTLLGISAIIFVLCASAVILVLIPAVIREAYSYSQKKESQAVKAGITELAAPTRESEYSCVIRDLGQLEIARATAQGWNKLQPVGDASHQR